MEVPAKKRRYYQRWLAEVSGSFWLVKKRPWLMWTMGILIGVFVVLPLVALGLFLLYLNFYTANLKDDQGTPLDFGKIENGGLKRGSYAYDFYGKEIIGRFFDEVRDPLPTKEIPELLAKAFVAAEDQHLFSLLHRGIDPTAMVRASLVNLGHRFGKRYGPKQGASGIPQQLARQIFAQELSSFRTREHSLGRKLIEAQVAVQLVRRYDKKTLLTTFLNQIYFGHGVNGVAEACRYYFGKDLKDGALSLREIAILVSLNKSARIYCPIFHSPAKAEAEYEAVLAAERVRIILARERYNWVLGRMLDEGDITEKQYREALFKKDEPMNLALLHVTFFKDPRFGYSNRMIKEMLFEQGYSDDEILFERGLWIRTGFDSRIQRIATEETNKQLAELNSELPEGAKLEGSFVVIENKTGRVVAFSGGHDFSATQYNRALALRSPGSAFKPIVFAAAFEFAGKTFADKICNCPFSMRGANGKRWAPKNFKEDNPVPMGYRPLPEILIRSVNLGTLNLARSIGLEPIIETAHRLGIWGERGVFKGSDGKVWFQRFGVAPDENGGLVPLLPTAIGASDVSLLELVNAYTVFARGGTYMRPQMILEIKDSRGSVLYQAEKQEGKRVLSVETARKIAILLRAVTKIGTAKISMRNIEQQVAMKTGTSNGPNDLAMIGFTPEYTFGFRFGYDQPKPIALPVYMKKVSGSADKHVSAGWVVGVAVRRFVDRVYENGPKMAFDAEVETGLKDLLDNYQGKK